jgi:23S rRNA (pseudouridine1915-N3)-methyltransferase
MILTLLVVGKTDEQFIREGIAIYSQRLKHYIDFRLEVIPDIKKNRNMSEKQQKKEEARKIISRKSVSSELHIFDEKGKAMTSLMFADFLQKKMTSGIKELILVIGGPYGFSDEVRQTAVSEISLSPMTFPHQLARLLCVEQIYRAFTIIKGEPYHHD